MSAATFSYDPSRLPPQCLETAESFQHCQQRTTENGSVRPTWVMACHRKWCNRAGHCEPCGGIGDRTRFLLSQVQDAAQRCMRIQLDYPVSNIAILKSVVYQDKYGWLAELLRFRAYDVSDRRPPPIKLSNAPAETKGLDIAPGTTFYTHFTPHQYLLHEYNPCYFHIIFQPSASLKHELDRHNAAIGLPSIGIHYRTGDAAAFGISNRDERVANDKAIQGLRKMLVCADELAQNLFPQAQKGQVTYFVATDNAVVKQKLQKNPEALSDQKIYITETVPGSYLKGLYGDGDAWEELYLLSMRQGIVANVVPKEYQGQAGKVSYFSILARRIGFMGKFQMMECVLD